MDINLYYIEKGKGKPLILLHGNGANNGYFKNQTDYFSRKYRVIAPDTRGHGNSPRGSMPFTLSQFADDLKDFLDSLFIKKAIISGFSDGANIAVIFALKYPDYVEKLILNGGNLSPEGIKPWIQIPICIGYGAVCVVSRLNKKAENKKEILGLMVNQPNIKPEDLCAINVPVLVIVGNKDMVKEKHSKMIADSIKNSRFCVIKGNHFIAAENSKEYNRKTEEFLNDE